MKNTYLLILLLFISGSGVMAAPGVPVAPINNKELPVPAAKADDLVKRLEQIKTLDLQKLTPGEKTKLKKEVKEIKKQLEVTGGGIYISAAGLLLIIILLILFL